MAVPEMVSSLGLSFDKEFEMAKEYQKFDA